MGAVGGHLHQLVGGVEVVHADQAVAAAHGRHRVLLVETDHHDVAVLFVVVAFQDPAAF